MANKCPKCDSDNPATQSYWGNCHFQLSPLGDMPVHTKTVVGYPGLVSIFQMERVTFHELSS